MSVIVKGMEMPKTCLQCMSSGFRTAIKCTEWTELSSGLRETIKALSCPLVEIPDKHGRLIDADAFFDQFSSVERTVSFGASGLYVDIHDLYEILSSLPTVIEAEGE